MSTKINVRSPFYLHLTEPAVPLPTYDCSADYADLKGFAVNNQGVVTEPVPKAGVLVSYTSSAGDFANGKFATVSSDTVRTITATLRIPAGFTNTSDIFFECNATATQEGTTTTVVAPAPCTTTVTNNGTIPAQTLNSGGNSVDINLSSYFTPGASAITSFSISNNNPVLASTAVSGSTLTISSNAIGGSNTIYASASDAISNSCTAVQAISVTINVVGAPTYICSTSPLTGGAIAADGTLTNPQTTGTITAHTPATSANSTGSARNVTLTFSITVPAGYGNAGATITCPHTISQPAQNVLAAFTCATAGLTGQGINDNGSITKGSTSKGSITGISPSAGFAEVTSNTTRSVDFTITVPSGYSNTGATIVCGVDLVQPGVVSDCGSSEFYISAGKQLAGDFCDDTYSSNLPVVSTASSINSLDGTKICKGGTPYNGNNLRYAVTTFPTSAGAGIGVDDFKVIQIDSNGIVLSTQPYTCASGGTGRGGGFI